LYGCSEKAVDMSSMDRDGNMAKALVEKISRATITEPQGSQDRVP